MSDRVLVAGIGNIFFGDDAFGVEVVRALSRTALPPGVRVADFGIRGMDLAYALLEPWEHVLLVDAVPRGGPPGTLYLLAPSLPAGSGLPAGVPPLDPHTMDPFKVLQLAEALGAPPHPLHLLGCEPGSVPVDPADEEGFLEMQDGLSAAVRRAVPVAVERVRRLVNDFLAKPAACAPAVV